ncbi:MAG: hypothetical protein V1772_01255 [Chloroflexota bacterium]
MRTIFRGVPVTACDILAAMTAFDAQYSDTNDYDAWLDKETYRYAVRHGDRLYPCKRILSLATGFATSEFGGGDQTNRVFRQLGFPVIGKP